MFGVAATPLLLAIESKELSGHLEPGVGLQLKVYLESLLHYIPSVSRAAGQGWRLGDRFVDRENLQIVSAAAYLSSAPADSEAVFAASGCDLLLAFEPDPARGGWILRVFSSTPNGESCKRLIAEQVADSQSAFHVIV